MPRLRSTSLGWFAACVWLAATAGAQEASAPPEPAAVESTSTTAADPPAPPAAVKPGVDRATLRRLLLTANPMLWPLAFCSILTVGYALERFLALRRKRVAPADFVDRFMERLAAGKLDRDRALELCKAHDCAAGRIFGHAVRAWGLPGAEIRRIVASDAAGEVMEMKRNLRVLSAMATLGPLLGLLGTVVGIIQAFDALGGRAGPQRGEMLAQGISLALIATAFGLAIAIVAVSTYYFLLNRVDVLTREVDDRVREVVDMIAGDHVRPALVERRIPLGPPADAARSGETRVV